METKLFKKTFYCGDRITVEVGTTGFCGGDAGHGGETLVRLTVPPSNFESKETKIMGTNGHVESLTFEIKAEGDWETKLFFTALEFAVKTLRAQLGKGLIGEPRDLDKEMHGIDS